MTYDTSTIDIPEEKIRKIVKEILKEELGYSKDIVNMKKWTLLNSW